MKELLYQQEFSKIREMILDSRNQAFQAVNRELVMLYWEIGKYITQSVKQQGWGKSVVAKLAEYLKKNEPELKGFTANNLWRMKRFYEIYQENEKLATLWQELSWSHNRTIFSRCKSKEEREFYLRLCVRERYSVRELDRQINTGVFERTTLADQKLASIEHKLPTGISETFRDSYVFEFLNLPKIYTENELQKALLSSLKYFILEIGRDFSFIGQEYRLQVGNSDFFVDLLFFHRDLRCLVVFELKIDKFRPEYLGQLEFYLEALDRDVKKQHENPSIGVLLCREKDDEVVKYALSRSLSPTVIAEYETKLIPKEVLRKKLNEFYELLEDP
ncbi:PDDEXK nuclease domain-containing protein [Desulfobacterales bacterium HSG16]|nr:PDDEXK nuclease domain-containing protein [Desulfobacterales bacterium HSG16]